MESRIFPRAPGFKIAIGVLAASLFSAPVAGLYAETRIELAVRQYRRGLPQDAEYYWHLAAREGNKASAFQIHKLRAFLDLRLMKIPEATRNLEAALSIQNDPFLAYVLARIYLDFRRYPEAGDTYEKAATLLPAGQPSANSPIHMDLLPFSCAEEMPTDPFVVFGNAEVYRELWDHRLAPAERAAAAWAGASIRKRFGGKVIPLLQASGQTVLDRLLSRPDDRALHAECIGSFAKMEKKIMAGASISKRIQSLRAKQESYYRMRYFWFGDEESLELLGRHLIYAARSVEALHVYRAMFFRRFKKLRFDQKDEHDRAAARDLAFTIRELAAVYGSLSKNQDRTVLLRVADAIENAGHTDLLVAREASQKQDNRECLYILSAMQPARRREMLERIRLRDEASVDSEFGLVFLPLYAEKGDPPQP